ncbi:serine/threonine-protein kinase [Phytoactinopolyspora mesophila]|uniref:non-specific serine/threonine protein kinase n=1 Tax=Phytoactinopolyspora mesophila TaxID=2650750 RepID=A0A7K3M2I5_9ACTN|nr:serine/threonine-protein kinase [Phytoactinopolyspora mesophila]NDL57511.1 protein kinase [Phytoactinopolyspora mesophila]
MAVLADRYELGEPLGAGGMARVVTAYDHVLHRDVAVKLIHDAYAGDPTSRERMLREARAAAGLQHPNTVSVFDAGEADGRPFIVMERVIGRSLAHRLHDEGALSVADTISIADAVLSALGAAHSRGLVHRDVKPSNILLPDSGGVKLADFGIAKALAETSAGLTSTGQLLGTPRYLSPEQVAGRPASPASDLYALGVVLYECLTGEPPFKAETPLAEALAHQREPVPAIAQSAPHAPAALARTLERALAKEPSDRFTDADAMRRALHDPAATLPPPPAASTSAATALLAPRAATTEGPTQVMGANPPAPPETAAMAANPPAPPGTKATTAMATTEPTAATEAMAEHTAATHVLTSSTAVVPPAAGAQTRLLGEGDSGADDTAEEPAHAESPDGNRSKRRWLVIAAVAAVAVLLVVVLVIANRGGDPEGPTDPPPADNGGDPAEEDPQDNPGNNQDDGGQPGGGRDEPRDSDNQQPGDDTDEPRDSDNQQPGDDTEEPRDPDEDDPPDDPDEEEPGEEEDDATGDQDDGEAEEDEGDPEPEDPEPPEDESNDPDDAESDGSADDPAAGAPAS